METIRSLKKRDYVMTASDNLNSIEASKFISAALERDYPTDILQAAKMCLVDWFGVALGAWNETPANAVRKTILDWGSNGRSQVLLGSKTTPSAAALINGTMAHCLDYDDTHVASTTHISAPTIAASFALGTHLNATEHDILCALITGFEVAARLGKNAGQPANLNGFHATGIFGTFGSVSAACVLLRLSDNEIQNAFGAAATQTGGLSASFGTMSKPFHAGKAAFNGILSAELARENFVTKRDLIEPDGGLSKSLYQDGGAKLATLVFSNDWEITQNTFKPYAACLLTHALIDAAKKIGRLVKSPDITEIEAIVSEPALILAGKKNPTTSFEGKFSLSYCAAIGLNGYNATEEDFSEERLAELEVQRLTKIVKLKPSRAMPQTAAELTVKIKNGMKLQENVPLALGNPGNPMNWDDIWTKFSGLVEPVLGSQTYELYCLLRSFEELGSLKEIIRLVTRQ